MPVQWDALHSLGMGWTSSFPGNPPVHSPGVRGPPMSGILLVFLSNLFSVSPLPPSLLAHVLVQATTIFFLSFPPEGSLLPCFSQVCSPHNGQQETVKFPPNINFSLFP